MVIELEFVTCFLLREENQIRLSTKTLISDVIFFVDRYYEGPSVRQWPGR